LITGNSGVTRAADPQAAVSTQLNSLNSNLLKLAARKLNIQN